MTEEKHTLGREPLEKPITRIPFILLESTLFVSDIPFMRINT
jgi:hypothetical protein